MQGKIFFLIALLSIVFSCTPEIPSTPIVKPTSTPVPRTETPAPTPTITPSPIETDVQTVDLYGLDFPYLDEERPIEFFEKYDNFILPRIGNVRYRDDYEEWNDHLTVDLFYEPIEGHDQEEKRIMCRDNERPLYPSSSNLIRFNLHIHTPVIAISNDDTSRLEPQEVISSVLYYYNAHYHSVDLHLPDGTIERYFRTPDNDRYRLYNEEGEYFLVKPSANELKWLDHVSQVAREMFEFSLNYDEVDHERINAYASNCVPKSDPVIAGAGQVI